MTQTTAQQKRKRDEEILLALAAAFTTGGGGYILLLTVRNLVGELGLPYDVANWLATMASSPLPEVGALGVPEGPCQVQEIEHAAAWRAMYLVAATFRLLEALPTATEDVPTSMLTAAKVAEERYYRRHQAAEDRRMRAAALQDMAARLNEDRGLDLLNWHAVMDEKTTYECAQANGYNFKADRMPVIGWPGAVHMECRCTAGPGVPGAPLMASV